MYSAAVHALALLQHLIYSLHIEQRFWRTISGLQLDRSGCGSRKSLTMSEKGKTLGSSQTADASGRKRVSAARVSFKPGAGEVDSPRLPASPGAPSANRGSVLWGAAAHAEAHMRASFARRDSADLFGTPDLELRNTGSDESCPRKSLSGKAKDNKGQLLPPMDDIPGAPSSQRASHGRRCADSFVG